jgi:hypothetical protein
MIAFAAFFILSMGALLYRKLVSLFGASVPATLGVGCVAVAVTLGARGYASRRQQTVVMGDEELDVSGPEVERELQGGGLSPGDLVRENGHWTTLVESMQFGETAAIVEAGIRRRAQAGMAMTIVLGVAAALVLLFFFANFSTVLHWLIAD